jgi:hypothetical protein
VAGEAAGCGSAGVSAGVAPAADTTGSEDPMTDFLRMPTPALEQATQRLEEQSRRVGELQELRKTCPWWRRNSVQADLSDAIHTWMGLVHIQESLWRQYERQTRCER